MKSPLSLIGASLVLLSSLPTASGAVLSFNPTSTIDFEDLEKGASVSTLDWTGSATPDFTGTTPGIAGNSSTMAVTAGGATSQTVIGPALTPSLKGDRFFFSAWVLRTSGSVVNGARFQVTSDGLSTGAFAGFGLTNSNPYTFAFWGDTVAGEEVKLGWIQSSVTASVGVWYELALVVDFDSTTPSNSLGSLYYRKTTDSEYTLFPEFDGVQMSWFTSEWNPTDFTKWRVINANGGAQFDNLTAGMVIPEPHVGILTGGAALGLALLHRVRKNSAKK